MQTSRFVELVERAYTELYGKENQFITVLYDPDPKNDDGPPASCLGLLIGAEEHMASVAAVAMRMIWDDAAPEDGLDTDAIGDIDEEMTDFVTLIQSMKVAPYMDWHVAYFEWANEDGDRNASEVLGSPEPTFTSVRWTPEELFRSFQELGATVSWYEVDGLEGECVAITGTDEEVNRWWEAAKNAVDLKAASDLQVYRFVPTDGHTPSTMYFPYFTRSKQQ